MYDSVKIVIFFLPFVLVMLGLANITKKQRTYIAISLIVLTLLFGISKKTAWPFFNWSLFPNTAKSEIEYYEIYVIDTNHDIRVRLDARAVPPTLTTVLRRMAAIFVNPNISASDKKYFAIFLLDRATNYAQDIQPAYFSFPRHEYGYKWKLDSFPQRVTFDKLRIQKRKVSLPRYITNPITDIPQTTSTVYEYIP